MEKIDGEIELFIWYAQFEELARVLDYPKLGFTNEQKAEFKALILENATLVSVSITLDAIKEDPTDNRILACAVVANVDYVISGDEHVIGIRKFDGIRIVTASEFLKEDEALGV